MKKFKKMGINNPVTTARQRREYLEKILSLLAFGLLLAAWFIGYARNNGDIEMYLPQVMPGAEVFEQKGEIWAGIHTNPNGEQEIIGYIGVGDSPGYGGPLKMMVAIDIKGNVVGALVVDHRETPSFFRRIVENDFLRQFIGRPYNSPFNLGEDIDGVTGASFTSNALATVIRNKSRQIAGTELGLMVPPESHPIQFGVPEITIILLYGIGFFVHKPDFPHKKLIRWAMLIGGMIILGFWLNRPLTIANFTSLLSGYWPDWHNNLYWFFLLGGIFFVITVDGKNPYCFWFCPFGAVQECLHAVGQGNFSPPREWMNSLKWTQRSLAFLAIFFGLAVRQPSATSYEVFGTMFGFIGTNLQWILLAMILLASLFIYRPWCNYLCPIDPVMELISRIRRWIQEQWKQSRKT